MARTLERRPAGGTPSPPRTTVAEVAGRGFRPTPAGWAGRAAAVLLPLVVGVWYVRNNAPCAPTPWPPRP
jgi:hypothetical protein